MARRLAQGVMELDSSQRDPKPAPAPLNPVKKWVLAIRAPFLTAAIVPIVIGGAVAQYDTGALNWLLFLLTLLGGMLAHAGSNLANDYFDDKSGNDRVNRFRSPFSGGTGMIQAGLVPAGQILTVALSCYAAAAAIGLYLTFLRGWPVLALMAFGGFTGFFYTAGPARLAYRGLGEAFLGLAFGPFLVAGAYFVQTQAFSARMWVASVPIGLLVTAILYINQYPDYEADRAVGKNNAVVRLGRRQALRGYYGLMGLTYVWLAGAVVAGSPWPTLASLLTTPLAAKALGVASRFHDDPRAILPANGLTILIHLTTGLLQAAGFFIAAAMGV